MPTVRLSSVSSIAVDPHGVDEANGILKGAIIASKGQPIGHDIYLGDAFLDELAKLKTLPVRIDPPSDTDHGGAMAIRGEATNFRREGDNVRADVALIDVKDNKREHVLALAQNPRLPVGFSLEFRWKNFKAMGAKLQEVLPPFRVMAVDFVERPASARSLFSEPVDTPATDSMNYSFLRQLCAKFSIAFPAEDKDVTPEIASKAEQDYQTKLAEKETADTVKLQAVEKDRDEFKAKLGKSPATEQPVIDYDKIIDGVTAKLQAKGLATVAGKPAAAQTTDDDKGKTTKLSVPQQRHMAQLKLKEDEYRAKLAALPDDDAREYCIKAGLDIDAYAENLAKFARN